MKPMYIRVVALLMLLSTLLTGWSGGVMAATGTGDAVEETGEALTNDREIAELLSITTGDGHVIAYPELLEQYEFPNDWSKAPLEFCVGNGILNGRNDGLAPKANTTRAETAALLVRLLGAKSEAPNLSRFNDVDPNAWYYGELAAAVELGIMNGMSATTLAPNSSITREQAFVLMSRAFGVFPENTGSWERFSDSKKISKYARSAIGGLAEQGIVNGYGDGTVKPDQPITRGELASLFYKLFTCICDTPESLVSSGNVLYRGSEPIPDGYTLKGSLTIGCGYQGEWTLTRVNVSKMLALRPSLGSKPRLVGCAVGTLSVPATMEVTADTRMNRVVSAGKGSVLSVPAGAFYAYNDCTIKADVGTLYCNADNITGTLNAKADKALIYGDGVTLTGSGKVGHVDVYGARYKVNVAYDSLKDHSPENPENALETVETLVVWDTVIRDTYLYTGKNLKTTIRALPVGTKLDHFYYRKGESAAQVYTTDGVFGWVPVDHISIPQEVELAEKPYSTAVMEAFVNKKGYSSSTKYLVWVSLKTQTVNVFTGSKGAWKLVKSMPCASGKNATPTIRGSFTITKKLWEWDFVTYKVRYVTVFYGGYAFHSRTYSPDYKQMLDTTMSTPVSDGCLRMLDEDCKYIFETIPKNTSVVVF